MYYPCFAFSGKDETFEIAIVKVNREDKKKNPFTIQSLDH